MRDLQVTRPADLWMRRMFDAKAARDGASIRRSTRDVDRIVGRQRFLAEIERRGYHAVENAGQIIVFCNNAPVRLLV